MRTPPQRYIKRIPLTCGLMIIALLGFTASLDISDILFKNASGNSAQSIAAALMLTACATYFVIGIIVIFAIVLIWRGIADWPLNPN
ncbi:MAG: hypothetical protein ABI970_15495 [Chloroflexota bacterium]|nr:hypothetical protein [Anaerolineae bacterium]